MLVVHIEEHSLNFYVYMALASTQDARRCEAASRSTSQRVRRPAVATLTIVGATSAKTDR